MLHGLSRHLILDSFNGICQHIPILVKTKLYRKMKRIFCIQYLFFLVSLKRFWEDHSNLLSRYTTYLTMYFPVF